MKQVGGLWLPDDERCMLKTYEDTGGFDTDLIRHLKPERGEQGIAIDGGAHVGSCALELAKRYETVYAVEPNRATYRCLKRNVENTPNIIPVYGCLGAMPWGSAETRFRVVGNTGSSQCIPGDGAPIVTLDQIAENGRVCAIKLDCEGMDYFALLGGVQCLLRDKPKVVYEFKDLIQKRYGLKGDQSAALLKALGYTFQERIRKNYLWIH